MKYFEVFSESGFHSAFMTTYAFGAQAFEDVPFSRLRGANCRNIVVLADRQMINQSFVELGTPKFAGSSYHLIKADAPGAFHPKITLLIGAKKGKLLVGSANLTALGLGGNKELVANLNYNEEAPGNAHHFADALSYIRSKVPPDDLWFNTAVQRALRSAPWLRNATQNPRPSEDTEQEVALLTDRANRTVIDQIAASIGGDPIDRLIIVSPYWDMKLEGLSRLRTILGMPPADLLIEVDTTYFPKSELPRLTDVELFRVDASDNKRFVHAKLIIALGQSWDHVISGSMNCTLPALLGPTVPRGNAEAGIYKRVPSNTALAALGLESYREKPVQLQDLRDLTLAVAKSSDEEEFIDGGTLTLHSGRITWKPPLSNAVRKPAAIALLNRDGSAFGKPIDLTQQDSSHWCVEAETERPRSGFVSFADGSVSAPIQIIDLDVLAIRTSPPAQGRKKSLIDTLAEAMNEDLILIEALNQLEELEFDEADELPKTTTAPTTESENQQYAVLTYQEFVRARNTAKTQGSAFPGSLSARHDSAANSLSAALNRIIGLVGVDLNAEEDRELNSIAAMDFRGTEPETPEDPTKTMQPEIDFKTVKAAKQAVATSKKMKEAVDAFEDRCRSLKGKPITTTELVRLRALLQILLSHAQPIQGKALPTQILPIYTKDGYEWPRLVGRLLSLHFGTVRALQNLQVAQDETEQKRVLEYLAMADWAARAAVAATSSHPKAIKLLSLLDNLANALATQIASIISDIEEDAAYFKELISKLDERFADRLALTPCQFEKLV
nr:hypothetical protein [uncultured Cohaesibacter sp.]